MSGTLPVIDISAPGAATALGRALEEIGFAYVAGHSVPQPTIDAAFAASRAFHASPLARKRSLAINEWHRGYIGMATSTVVSSSVAKVTRPNLSESVMIMQDVAPGDADWGEPLQGPNQWPDWLPGFRPAIDAYRDAAEGVSRRIIRLIARALDLGEDALDPHFARPTTFLRLLHYPPHPVDAEDDQFGAAPHTDYGIITLLAQDSSGGLQVRRRDGGWIDAAPLAGTFVLNVADMLARWTNDRFVSTPHRVVNRSGGDRYSLPYFFDTSMASTIECLATCTGPGNPAKYPPVRYGDYLLDRINRNYHYRHKPAAAE
ncbi:MAG TPA: 2OG-Fe(II) oxygenase family protein [Stellaceae bacterium]|nr:2OG-Fe(II) oxygenase family protein [Stellaceae bacterium]